MVSNQQHFGVEAWGNECILGLMSVVDEFCQALCFDCINVKKITFVDDNEVGRVANL
ncbi:MAG: hypothetical protein OJF59_000340 [Cytophagales bacterium]|nr:MAG: hypothetical protein OJF59_000340 [Cytophagales bacterium]